MKGSKCKDYVSKKVATNIREGRWPTKQAIAIAYSQVQRVHPACKQYLRR